MYGFIYITTNKINGRKYIGQKKYRKGWETYLGSGTALKEAINKYGKENFTRKIITQADSKEELNQLEKEYIKKHNAVKSKEYYNIAEGGNVISMPPEKQVQASKKISERYSGKNAIWYGKHHKEESKRKIGETRKLSYLNGAIPPMTGKKHSEKTKKQMSESMTGILRTEEGRKNISVANRKRAPIMFAVKKNVAYKFNSLIDLSEWLIKNGKSHSDKVANVKRVIGTRVHSGKEYYGYIFFKDTVKVNVETIETIN